MDQVVTDDRAKLDQTTTLQRVYVYVCVYIYMYLSCRVCYEVHVKNANHGGEAIILVRTG